MKRWFNDDWQTHRAEAAHVHRRRDLRLPFSLRRQPESEESLLPEEGVLRPRRTTPTISYGKPLPSFSWLIEKGKVCALNFPIGMNAGLAKALGVMMKLDFERAVLNRVPEIEAHPRAAFPAGALPLRRVPALRNRGRKRPHRRREILQPLAPAEVHPHHRHAEHQLAANPRCPAIAGARFFQTFRTKIFLALSDDFSARTASELCGREDQLKVSYNLSESGHDSKVSLLTGKAVSHKANITASKSYNTQSDYRFDMKTFTELHNAQSVIDCLRRT